MRERLFVAASSLLLPLLALLTGCGSADQAPTSGVGAGPSAASPGLSTADPGSAAVQAISPDRHLTAVAYGGFVQLWDTSDPAHMARVGPPIASPGGAALSLSFSPDGRSLAIGGAAHQLQLWDVSTPTHPVLRTTDTFGQPR